jgi:hypothetical protein
MGGDELLWRSGFRAAPSEPTHVDHRRLRRHGPALQMLEFSTLPWHNTIREREWRKCAGSRTTIHSKGTTGTAQCVGRHERR